MLCESREASSAACLHRLYVLTSMPWFVLQSLTIVSRPQREEMATCLHVRSLYAGPCRSLPLQALPLQACSCHFKYRHVCDQVSFFFFWLCCMLKPQAALG